MTYDIFKQLAYRHFESHCKQRTISGWAGHVWVLQGFKVRIAKWYYPNVDNPYLNWNGYWIDGMYVSRGTFISRLLSEM